MSGFLSARVAQGGRFEEEDLTTKDADYAETIRRDFSGFLPCGPGIPWFFVFGFALTKLRFLGQVDSFG